ncbi:MAG: diacylglycerol kinase family protein [Marinifilaceae bacterium]
MNTSIKLLAIINPISGTGKQKGMEELLQQHLDSSKFQLHTQYTQYAGHGSAIAKEAIQQQFDAVLAIGGDGTINEIARSLAGSEVAMGIIPCGSGNGLARHLGIPMDTVKAIQWLNKAEIKKMDTVKANNELFVNVAGVGFDAFISHEFAKMESRGLISYAKAVIKSFFSYPLQDFIIETKEQKHQLQGLLLSFANSSQFGNNAYIAPKASIQDGQINLVLLKRPKLFQIPGLALKTFTKRLETSSLFTQIKGDEFLIRQNDTLGHVDGEPIEFGSEIHLIVCPQSLNVFTCHNC